MDLLTRRDLRALLEGVEAPCVSIFIPTQRGGGEADRIHWRNSLAVAREEGERHGVSAAQMKEVLRPAHEMLDEMKFGQDQADGLACFLAPGFCRVYRVPLAFSPTTVVGKRFHITPLLPLLTGDGRFFVLALSQKGARLFEGTRQTLSPMEVKDMPQGLEEALATHDVDNVLTYHSRPTSGGTWGAIFSGHGVGIDDHKSDLLRYFQMIDRALHPILAEEQAPLVLASVKYLMPLFRQACTYAHLLPEGIEGNPDRVDVRELHEKAWTLVASRFTARKESLLGLYRQLAGTGRTAAGLGVIPAACKGEIETLFMMDRPVWGRFNPDTGTVETHTTCLPGDEDLLNLTAAHMMQHKGTIHVLPADHLPDNAPLAGIFWLPRARHG